MRDTRHSISFNRASTALGLCWLLAIGGCSSESSRLDEVSAMFDTASKDPVQSTNTAQLASATSLKSSVVPAAVAQAAASQQAAKVELRKSLIADRDAAFGPIKVSPAAETQKTEIDKPVIAGENSSWCTSLRETAAANGYILRSPVLTSSYDDQGKAEMALGLSYSNFHRADLLKARAEAECRKYMAQTGLQRLVFTAPQNLTMAGFKAKADAIDREKSELERLRQNVLSHMNGGDINREKATALLMLINQLQAEGQSARSQAARRIGNIVGTDKPARALGNELLRAEQDLDTIDSQIRTSENFDVGAQAIYGQYVDGVPTGTNPNTLGLGGRVTLSMKLGVIDPRRFEHERLAAQAKQSAIRDEGFGPIWQANQLRGSHQRALFGLEESRRDIAKALAEAKHLLATLADVSQPEFTGAKLSARFQVMKLQADQAAVDGSITDIQRNLKQLSSG